MVFKEVDCLQKATFFHGHNQINRVEVYTAVKASGQVGFRISGGMKVVAQRALKPEDVGCVLRRKMQQIGDQGIDWDLVSKQSQIICRVMFIHDAVSYGRENSVIVWFTKASVIFFWLRAAALIRQAVATLLICRGTPPV